MLDRKKIPLIKEVSKINLPIPEKIILDNGIPVQVLNIGTQEILKLEVVYFGGRPFEEKKLVGRATAQVLKEGTLHHNAQQIAETIDFYGGSISTPVYLDTSNIVLFCLKKHFEKLLGLLSEILHEPIFPKEELQTFIRNGQQRLQIDLTKNEVVAYRKITEFIFGEEHPYGYNSVADTYLNLQQKDLQAHHKKNYTDGNCMLFLSGKMDKETIETLNKFLGQSRSLGKSVPKSMPKINSAVQKIKIENKDSIQTAIRIGRRMFTRKHKDYNGMFILNTLLGGYFGSRLMTNIREDKGYTYNIFSSLDTMLYDGYFMIGTEVGNDYVEATIKEIHKEFELLQNELVGEEELKMLRSYLLGNLLSSLDGPFNVSEIIRTLAVEDIPFEAFEAFVQTVKTISAKELQRLAQKYLDKDKMWEVLVGA